MEIWDVYDINRKKVGKVHERGVPLLTGEYHLTVEVWVVDSSNRILLSQRHPSRNNGLLWECSGGSVLAGEESVDGAQRECKEEIGIEIDKQLFEYIGSDIRKDYIIDTYVVYTDIICFEIKMTSIFLHLGLNTCRMGTMSTSVGCMRVTSYPS